MRDFFFLIVLIEKKKKESLFLCTCVYFYLTTTTTTTVSKKYCVSKFKVVVTNLNHVAINFKSAGNPLSFNEKRIKLASVLLPFLSLWSVVIRVLRSLCLFSSLLNTNKVKEEKRAAKTDSPALSMMMKDTFFFMVPDFLNFFFLYHFPTRL